MLELPHGLAPELAPVAWMIGEWAGVGVVEFDSEDSTIRRDFRQELTVSHDGNTSLVFDSRFFVDGASAAPESTLAREFGFLRISRVRDDADNGPGLLPASAPASFVTVDDVEKLRNKDGFFDVEFSTIRTDGVSELYVGQAHSAKTVLHTDAVVRGHGSKPYTAAHRLFGFVDSRFLWAWDMAACGQSLRNHASAVLENKSQT